MLSLTFNDKLETAFWQCPSCNCMVDIERSKCPSCMRIIPKPNGLRKNRNLRITWHWLR